MTIFVLFRGAVRGMTCAQAAKPAQPVVRDKHQELAKARVMMPREMGGDEDPMSGTSF